MSDEEDKEKSEESQEENKEPKVDFSEVDDFLEKGEESIEKAEKKVEESLEKEEEKVEKLEGEKESIDERKKEIEEKIIKEKEKVEELRKEEEELKETVEKAEEFKEDIKKKGFNITKSLKNLAKIFKSAEEESKETEEKKRNTFKRIYEKNYKILLILPFLMFLLAIVQRSHQYNTTGDFVNRGVELKGGITLTIPAKTYAVYELEQILNEELPGDISVRKISQTKGLLIEASDVSQEDLLDKVQEILGELNPETDYSIEQMGSALGKSFFREIIRSIIIAFILMALVVFITFRVPAPSLAVILSALSDIVVTLAIFNLTGAKLGKGGVAAFLMIIGYSVDTDILLSTKVLKRKFGTVMDRIYSAMKTGLTMNLTTIVAITVAMVFTQSETIKQIMTILLIGLFVDIINTWIQNVGILRLYIERKQRKRQQNH